ncbi:MAG: hypothetical protein NW202_13345 [Nitrospira sp.]|nr:hypothetical protein [Nitrospira sp.]
MKGHRPSSLPIARFCGLAPSLSSGIVTRAAVKGTAFHGLCSGDPKALDTLTEEERADVSSWIRPTNVDMGDGVPLRYVDAVVEQPIGLLESGGWCEADDPQAMTAGTPDMWWEPATVGDQRVLYLGDIKSSEFTSEPMSLQLLAYAFAVAAKVDATHFCTGIWAAKEGRWWWGDVVDLSSDRALELFAQVKHAALNTGTDYVTGGHCSGCYGRSRCPAWLMPPEAAETSLAPLTVDTARDLTSAKALELLLVCKRVTEMADKVTDILKAWAQDHGGIVDGDKVWGPISCPGRMSLDRKALDADHPGLLKKYEKQGKGYEKYDWRKLGPS